MKTPPSSGAAPPSSTHKSSVIRFGRSVRKVSGHLPRFGVDWSWSRLDCVLDVYLPYLEHLDLRASSYSKCWAVLFFPGRTGALRMHPHSFMLKTCGTPVEGAAA